MKRNIVISAIIGVLTTYLPFWMWDGIGEQITGVLAIGAVTFVALLVTEKTSEMKVKEQER
ncbi:MAG: hypothetical protein Q4F03_09450 [Eubacteriales bacterium]|nr:hypothetical protein [Eubacteriales bacterium]